MNISATHFRMNFTEYLETAQREPVIVEKHGKPIVALVSYRSYSSHRQNLKPVRAVPKSIQKELTGYLDTSYGQPIMVESKPGQPVAVMVSYQTYQQEMKLKLENDRYLRLEKALPVEAPVKTTQRDKEWW